TKKLAEKLVEAISPLMNREDGAQELGDTCTRVLSSGMDSTLAKRTKEIDSRLSAIINSKIAEHQLDNAELTAKELGIIRQSFLETIMNKSHARPEYLR
ncbi:MAG: hypothetical protein J6S21_03700, partial [Victivallales bacterium]|nr:hypothetical protein [Victivallales bacterium]